MEKVGQMISLELRLEPVLCHGLGYSHDASVVDHDIQRFTLLEKARGTGS